MPVTKIPVVYKFGIVSSSKKLELQEQLLKQSFQASNTKTTKLNPIEVTEEFVQLFNSGGSLKEQQKYEKKANILLERAKRRSGVRNCGQGSHVNLPLAWTELAQLAQCKGRVQEESLNILVTSLEVSSLERFHIPALFYLAETMLYWLRTEEVCDPFIRAREIMLLKMGQLVFERLFYHHMAGQLQEYADCKRRLCTYTDGLEELQEVYDNFPYALLCLKFIIEVKRIILADVQPVLEHKNKDQVPSTQKQTAEETTLETKQLYEYYSNDDVRSSNSAALSSSVHDLSPTLWHALDVFRCTNSLSGGLMDALKALEYCGAGLASETRVDGMVAIQILGESAKTNMAAMKVLHNLAMGVRTSDEIPATRPLSYRSCISDFSIICDEKDWLDMGRCKCDTLTVPPGNPQNIKMSVNDPLKENKGSDDRQQTTETRNISYRQQTTGTRGISDRQQITISNDATIRQHTPDPAVAHEKQMADSDLRTDREQKGTTTEHLLEVPGIAGWHWEVALVYAEALENIVLFGSTAVIRKQALVGCGPGNGNFNLRQDGGVSSAGLVSLAFFYPEKEAVSGELSPNDWGWRLRFGAIHSLEKICCRLKGDSILEGLRNTAWNVLLKAKAKEKDCRVLEALRVAQVHMNTSNLLDLSQQDQPVSLVKYIAARLSTMYLPAIPPPMTATPRIQSPHWSVSQPAHMPVKLPEAKQLRTTIKQEISLAAGMHEPTPGYNIRKSYDLRRIVEDQWRKELQAKLDEDEKEELESLKEKQQLEEDRQKQIQASRQQKFRKKSLALPGQENECAS